jgi:Ni,Fe-hydrogenase III large subunit
MAVTVILQDETSISNIAKRIFTNLPDESRKNAETELIKLNPILSDTKAIKAGVIIKVPEISSLVLNTQQVNNDPTTQTKEVIKNAIESYHKQLLVRIESQHGDLRNQIDLIKSVGQLSISNPELQLIIETIEKSVAANLGDAKVLSENLDQVFGQISADLSK